MLKWGLILCTVFVSSCGDILCAKGMSQGGELTNFNALNLLHIVRYIITRRLVILGGLCYAVAFFSLLGLLTVAQLSVAVPATALSFVVDTLGAHFVLKERIPWKRWIGVILVSLGVVLAVKPAGNAPTAAPLNPAPPHVTPREQGQPQPTPSHKP
ncbi:MAG TPA: EamA family transporter [Acidobacteriaceae bacterium]|nr:EamA family transporter [Acidobacteriaceae bacterium]